MKLGAYKFLMKMLQNEVYIAKFCCAVFEIWQPRQLFLEVKSNFVKDNIYLGKKYTEFGILISNINFIIWEP